MAKKKSYFEKTNLERYMEDYTWWQNVYKDGCGDPLYTDGYNLNSCRNRMTWLRKAAIEDMENGLYPKQDVPEIPFVVPDDYMAHKEEKIAMLDALRTEIYNHGYADEFKAFIADYDKYHKKQDKFNFPHSMWVVNRVMKDEIDRETNCRYAVVVFRGHAKKDAFEEWLKIYEEDQPRLNEIRAVFAERKKEEVAKKKPIKRKTKTEKPSVFGFFENQLKKDMADCGFVQMNLFG